MRKHLRASEEMRLIFSLGKVISLLPMETIYVYLNAIVSPYVEKLQSILAKPPVRFSEFYTNRFWFLMTTEFVCLIDFAGG